LKAEHRLLDELVYGNLLAAFIIMNGNVSQTAVQISYPLLHSAIFIILLLLLFFFQLSDENFFIVIVA
jgi:hypothetical protein